jgi:hypothetical protein
MTLSISFKDTGTIKVIENVQTCWFDYGTLNIVMEDGTLRSYPDRHIFYVEIPEYYK